MEHVAPDFSISIINPEIYPMSKTNVNPQPQFDDSGITTSLEKFDGLATVAAPDGESANETQFERTYPKHGTQPARLLAGLLLGCEYTHKDAWNDLGISRLSAVAGNLTRKFGWRVENPGLRVVNRFGEKTTIGLYKLHVDDIGWGVDDAWDYFSTEYKLMHSLQEKANIAREAACSSAPTPAA